MTTTIDGLLALDVGTSSLKATLYDTKGKLLAKEVEEYPISSPQPGWVEQDPEDWWQACCLACRRLSQRREFNIMAISVSGQAPGCVPVNQAGKPVRPAILWLDRRSAAQVEWLSEKSLFLPIVLPGLNIIDSYYGGVKWLWYRQQEPENYASTWKILQANSFIIHRLTGESVIDPGHAGICSPCFDGTRQIWSKSYCDLMEIDIGKLPDVFPSREVIGSVTRLAFQATGLQVGTPVLCGTADFICSYLGSGAAGHGSVSIMLGTAGNLMALSLPKTDPRLLNTFYINGKILSTGGVLAGAAVQWFINMLKTGQPNILDILAKEAAGVEPGANGLVFLPYLMGERSPIWDPDARGVYFGLSMAHDRSHLYRALLEGVAYAFRQLAEIIKENGAIVNEAVVINGGADNTLWRQIIADVLDLPIRYRPSKDGTSIGGAYLAALGVGIFDGLEEIRTWLDTSIDTFPNPENHRCYQHNYTIYASLYEKLKKSFKDLTVSEAGPDKTLPPC